MLAANTIGALFAYDFYFFADALLFGRVEKLAPSDVKTFVLGESGTGKEVLVRILHELSNRSGERLVAINRAAIPENLLESELFGYEKGAFTGAVKTTRGTIETADRGILFLDEIGDLPMSLQSKLLRFLQERVIERIGRRKEIPVDVRVICATHQDLSQLISDGRFREDLYYRINEATIVAPPLRERQGDAVVLARAFLPRFAAQHKRPVKTFSPQALALIEQYKWPGNVRELENRVKRAVVMAD
jgi:two-component system NtrC family response regulator